jgi:hypothetical protein
MWKQSRPVVIALFLAIVLGAYLDGRCEAQVGGMGCDFVCRMRTQHYYYEGGNNA